MGQLIAVSPRTGSDWLRLVIEALQHTGCVVVTDVLDSAFLEKTRTALYRAQQAIGAEVGADRLERAKELGVLRLPMKAEAHFLRFLEIPELLQIVDATLSPAAILHLQNGFILPSFPPGDRPRVFQGQYHRDFPRYLNGYLASLNALFAIDAFTEENGATRVAPGTHQRPDPPSRSYLEAASLPVLCSAGSMLVFDSTVWHAAGENVSGHDRLAINHQFTRSFFKPQIDYVRALGDDVVLSQPPRTQQLLGWYTRVPATLGEYYRGPEDRLYRAGQG